jgi:alpha-amylase
MSTKYWKDPVHVAFSPYKNPYDAYINFMNVLTDFEGLVG